VFGGEQPWVSPPGIAWGIWGGCARAEAIDREYRAAETATTGYMVNRRGREAGVDPRSLFTGPESRARKYGSDELLNYFEANAQARLDYRNAGIRSRMTSEESYWRDQYERAEYNIDHGLAA
jgi:hypothetical protein